MKYVKLFEQFLNENKENAVEVTFYYSAPQSTSASFNPSIKKFEELMKAAGATEIKMTEKNILHYSAKFEIFGLTAEKIEDAWERYKGLRSFALKINEQDSVGNELYEKKYSDQERKELEQKGMAMPGGRFPVKDSTDLKNAIWLLPKAKGNVEDVIKYLAKRLKELGATNYENMFNKTLHTMGINKDISHYEVANESINEAKGDLEEIEKKLKDYIKKNYDREKARTVNQVEIEKLEYQSKLLKHKGADEKEIEKIKTQIDKLKEVQSNKYSALWRECQAFEKEILDMNPKGKKKVLNSAIGNASSIGHDQAWIDSEIEISKIYAGLAQKAGKELSKDQKELYDSWARSAKDVSFQERGLKSSVEGFKQDIEDLYKKGGGDKKMTAQELAEYVWKNWKKITGLSASDRNEEGEFPDEVQDLMKKHEIDYQDFSDAWTDEADTHYR
jgi:hypothetical protein